MTMRLRVYALTTLLIAIVASTATAFGATARHPQKVRSSAGMQLLVEGWRARADVPAVVAGVEDLDGQRWLAASGTRQMRGGGRVAVDAQFRIASITKLFVATVIMQLVAEGRLDLDDPASDYVRGVRLNGATIHQLLSHTSGIPDYAMTQGLSKQLLENRERRWSTSDIYGLITDVEPDFATGDGYQYSNTNYVVLGDVIEEVTGAAWAREVRRRVLDPLRLADTYVAGFEAPRGDIIPGYFDADNDGDVEDAGAGRPWPSLETSEAGAGAIVSTAADLLTFGRALFGGKLLATARMRRMVAELPHHPRNSNYGLGVETVRPDYRTTIWGHGGLLPGYRSVLWYVPAQDVVVVVLANDVRANPADLAELVMRTTRVERDEPDKSTHRAACGDARPGADKGCHVQSQLACDWRL
jgi:D-alanyl-D-alanine carboxypeptidase